MPPTANLRGIVLDGCHVGDRDLQPTAQRPELVEAFDLEYHTVALYKHIDHGFIHHQQLPVHRSDKTTKKQRHGENTTTEAQRHREEEDMYDLRASVSPWSIILRVFVPSWLFTLERVLRLLSRIPHALPGPIRTLPSLLDSGAQEIMRGDEKPLIRVEDHAALRRAMSSRVNESAAPGNSSPSWAGVRALAIGAITVGWTRSHASDTAATVARRSAAMVSSASSSRKPRASRYACAPAARGLSTCRPGRYLPVRNPFASA